MATQFEYDTESLWQKDRDHNIHPWTDFSTCKEEGSMVMANSEGAYVSDSDGKRYIDGIGGLWCNNIGYAMKRWRRQSLIRPGRSTITRYLAT